ncbi:MAG: SGNH/GDSL hydrolase family protein [Clostridia bacterium]|nr:SGNH/GDSL hydrolase family protein [Clostridia bacterium]
MNFSGKRLSILGDSISTYRGVSDDASANVTLYGYPYYYRPPFSLSKTYWKRVMDQFGLVLCVNNSWSGGNLSGRAVAHSGLNRARFLSNERGEAPDVILVFMGINDLGRRVPLSKFAADYERTLLILKEQYPNASVCCVNLPDRDPFLKADAERFNMAISDAVRVAGDRFFVADLFHSALNNDDYYNNTLDGLHPDEDGMRMIAEVVTDAFARYAASC